ncbi:MAG: response regulator [Anaerolineae bacterium]|nr:response regulator [Anaerolineae bacterium]
MAIEITEMERRDLHTEIDALRQSLLPKFLWLMFILSWFWYIYVALRYPGLGIHDLSLLLLPLMSYLAIRLSKKSHYLSCWLFVSSMLLTDAFVALSFPLERITVVFAPVAIIAAGALFGALEALGVTTVAWLLHALAHFVRGEYPLLSWPILEIAIPYYLIWAASWLASYPLQESVESALAGWAQAREALKEARNRRGELYRVVRALEEATFRIERMNNELIVARQEAEEAKALKARFVATVSHELRGPLNLILGFTRMMVLSPESYGGPLPMAYRSDMYTVYRTAQHLSSLVDDVLDLSQIEARRLPLVKERIDLDKDVIGKVVDIVRPLAERKGLYLRVEVEQNLPELIADPVRLRQALLNLLTNALRFTEKGGITIKAKRTRGHLLVSVQDTGPGIAAEDLPKLFREFHQLHRPQEKEKGSGLGLAISKHLIELHGGEIWAESVQGEGTVFHFTVPLPGMRPVEVGLLEARELSPSLEMPICLVVHDDPLVVRMLARHLEGYRVVGLPDAQEVRALTEMLHPRAIVVSTEEEEQVLAQLDGALRVPVINCALPRSIGGERADGVLSYLIKPIEPEMIMSIMKRVEREPETKVLLVDDDPDTVKLLERMLTSLPRPYRILKAYDGLQALEIMQQEVPDIVFMDLLMPGLDGRQTIAKMRMDERTREVPVVIISARDWEEEDLTIGDELRVRYCRPISLSKGMKYLQALLDAFRPDYLPELERA